MSKTTISLQHEGTEYVNRNGEKAKADFRETDARDWFLKSQAGNKAPVVRVYRVSHLGEALIARFEGSAASQDAQDFARKMNENYAVLGTYRAEVR